MFPQELIVLLSPFGELILKNLFMNLIVLTKKKKKKKLGK